MDEMKLKEAAKDVPIMKAAYNVGFNHGDETQFDVSSLGEMERLWEDFCKEEGCDVDSVDYVEYFGPWNTPDEMRDQIDLLRKKGYSDAADLLGNYVNGTNELNFIKSFICRKDHEGDFGRKTLRCLWTAYCQHQDLEPDTAVYDGTIHELWDLVGQGSTPDWCDFDSFDFYMGIFLA